jgi:hypothetical protein
MADEFHLQYTAPFLEERKIHDSKQVTDPTQLVPRRKYLEMVHVDKGPAGSEEHIVGGFIFLGLEGTGWEQKARIKTAPPSHIVNLETTLFLSDSAVLRYPSGWNPHNYIVPAEE